MLLLDRCSTTLQSYFGDEATPTVETKNLNRSYYLHMRVLAFLGRQAA